MSFIAEVHSKIVHQRTYQGGETGGATMMEEMAHKMEEAVWKREEENKKNGMPSHGRGKRNVK